MRKAVLPFLAFVLTACASTASHSSSPTFEGETHADPALKIDALSNALLFTSLNGCSNIGSVSTSVVKPPSGDPGRERVEEKWVLTGCDRSFPFSVTLTGDGEGGAFFKVERQF